MAIRDDRPGVHIFGQYDETKRYAKESRFLRSGDVISGTWAAPSWSRYSENFDEDRSDEDISRYLIDGGLWTACRESWLIMEKRFEQSKRKRYDEGDGPRYDRTKEVFTKATTGCFSGTPLHLMTVFPHQDLFVLQHNDLEKASGGVFGFHASMATYAEGFNGVRHVAFEYDLKWAGEIAHDGCLTDDIRAIMYGAVDLDLFDGRAFAQPAKHSPPQSDSGDLKSDWTQNLIPTTHKGSYGEIPWKNALEVTSILWRRPLPNHAHLTCHLHTKRRKVS
ncbi:hypothetical protein F52700_1875 [Fusarium sp. NRRL 52700]|nr:hypothetical protein F52700_1875 [Fusarium sp. NRRL 52700]